MTQPPTTGPDEPETSPQQTAAAVPESLRRIWARLRRHKVMQWTLAYAAAAYTLLHGAEMVSNALHWPELVVRITLYSLILGLPIAMLLAWYHGHKAQHRISGPELAMLTVLLFMAGTLLWALAKQNIMKRQSRRRVSSLIRRAANRQRLLRHAPPSRSCPSPISPGM